jgi:hypothetical protein
MDVRRALLSPLTSIIIALLSLATLSIAIRSGQSPALVAYGVGISIGGILSVLFAAGSTLAFITGNLHAQAAARSLRVRVVIPCSVVATIAAGYIYSALTGVSTLGILLGGAIAILNASSELEVSYLRRKLRTDIILWIEVSSRLIGLLFVLSTIYFPLALTLSAFIRYLLLYFSAADDLSRKMSRSIGLNIAFRDSIRLPLLASSLLYVFLDRISFIVFPLFATETLAGYFVAIMSGQQAIAGALASGLQTTMASRSEGRAQKPEIPVENWYLRFELLIVAISVLLTASGLLLYNWLISILGIPVGPDVELIWALVLIAMPFGTAARAVQYTLLSTGGSLKALTSISAGVFALIAVLAIAVFVQEWVLVAVGLIAAEAFALVTGLLSLPRRRLS